MGLVQLILSAIKSFFDSNKAVADMVKKAEPDAAERKERLEIEKPRLSVEERDKIADICFREIKNNREVDVANYVEYATDVLNEEDRKDLTQILKERILDYRKKHPIIFHKWLEEHK